MREEFANQLYMAMEQDENIWLICADVGYGIFDLHFEAYPTRCLNTGAAEFSALSIASNTIWRLVCRGGFTDRDRPW